MTYTREQVHAALTSRLANPDRRGSGIWLVDGWLDLIMGLHERFSVYPDYRVVEVSETFGGLRFDTVGLPDVERDWARTHARALSLGVCQQCGSTEQVALRRHGWVATLCEGCDSPTATRGYRSRWHTADQEQGVDEVVL